MSRSRPSLVLALGAGVVLAGTPARGTVTTISLEALQRPVPAVDPATLPPITVEQDVYDVNHELATTGIADVAVVLAQNLELENLALLRHDDALLTAVDHGDRLAEMRARLERGANGTIVVDHYAFDSMDVSLLTPFGVQTGLSLGFHSRGTVTHETFDANDNAVGQVSEPFDLIFAMRRATGARWLNVGVLPPPS